MSRLAKAVALFGASSVIGTLTQVLKGKVAALVLGPAGVGVLGQLTNLWSLFNAISGLSLFNGIVQRIASGIRDGDQDLVTRQFATSLLFLTIFSCFATLVGVALSPWMSHLVFGDDGQRAPLVAVVLLCIPFSVTSQTYRSVMTGHALVKPVVKAQVAADLLSAITFIPLVVWLDLWGAVIGFCLLQVFKLAFQLRAVKHSLGGRFISPSFRDFRSQEIQTNLGFGANGILMAVMSVGAVLIIVRMIISVEGMEAAGLYTSAWKVATLYFGAIYAAAGGFFLPMLVAARNHNELSERVNETAGLYLIILPPAIICLLGFAPELMTLLFSNEFASSATLLALMLPADLMRVTAETMGLCFLATRKLFKYSIIYLAWVVLFLAASYAMLLQWGLNGVAFAYLGSHLLNFVIVVVLCAFTFNFGLASSVWKSLLVGMGLCVLPSGLVLGEAGLGWRVIGTTFMLALFLFVNWRQPEFQRIHKKIIHRLIK